MNQNENRKTTKMVEGINIRNETKKLSQEQMQREYDYPCPKVAERHVRKWPDYCC